VHEGKVWFQGESLLRISCATHFIPFTVSPLNCVMCQQCCVYNAMLVVKTDENGEWNDLGDKFSEENVILFKNNVIYTVHP
jgi:hypothetical protein